MSEIRKHQCPSCGGNLSVDNDKQMYRCTSCGSTYDYGYFREEQMHDMGETYLSRGEYMAAVDAYKLILEKEPHDFRALRGIMLGAARLNNIDELTGVGEAKHFSYNAKLADDAIKNASEQDKDYFTKLGKIYADKVRLIDCNREIKSLTQEHDRIDTTCRLIDDSRIDYYFDGRHGAKYSPKTWFCMMWGATAFFIALPFLTLAVIGFGDVISTVSILAVLDAILVLACAAYNFGRVYPRMKKIKEIDGEIIGYNAESGRIGMKIRELEEEVRKLDIEIRRSIDNFIKDDRLIMSGPLMERVPEISTVKKQVPETSPVKEQASEIGAIKKHQCPSCGGRLRVDSDKQMYLCTYCGSTYDYEYFREDQIHEVGETYLSRKEFMATADAYEFMLKKDPHDFLALRGLMLAAAHMTTMDELDKEDEPGKFSYDTEKVNRAIESALEEDKEYFKELANVYSEKKALADHAKELEALWEEKRKFNDVIAQNNTSRNRYYVGGKNGKAHPAFEFFAFLFINIQTLVFAVGFGIGLVEAYKANSDATDVFLGFLIFFSAILLGLLAYDLFYLFPKWRKLKKMEKENSKLYVESGRIDRKITALEDESAKLLSEIKRSIHSFVKRDRAVMADKIDG